MNTLNELIKTKEEEVSKQNLDRGQKRSKVNAFIKNVFAVIELISDRQKKRPDIEYHYISQDKFKDIIKRDDNRAEVMKFLKENNIIEVLKKDGKEFYIHFQHETIGLRKQPKGYKITQYGHQILKEAASDVQFKKILREYKVKKKEIKKYTPEDVMNKYSKEEYYLKTRTRQNIEKVLKNNLELEFHPLSEAEMVKLYKEEKPNTDTELIKRQLELVKDYFANKEFTYNVRLYSAFTTTPKCWRKFVTNKNGEKIVELFDIRSSILNILPLVCRMVFVQGKINMNKFNAFLEEEKMLENILNDKDQDIYKVIGEDVFDRQKIKDNLMLVVFRDNENVKKIEYKKNGEPKKTAKNQIKLWLRKNTPVMYEILSTFEQIKDGEKTKSMFWYYFQKFETELMVNVNGIFSDKLHTKIYNIHDGCFVEQKYVTEENKKRCLGYYVAIKNKLKQQISSSKQEDVIEEKNSKIFKDFKESTKYNIIEWLKITGTKQDLELVEKETYFDLYKTAYNYNAGRIKSTREMKG